MWYYLIPLLTIIYLGMAFVSGPIYVRATQEQLSEGSDTFVGYTVASVFWPVCLPVCLVFCAARSTTTLWVKYAKFLENYYKKHKQIKEPLRHRDYY
jgi:hypothetical protein